MLNISTTYEEIKHVFLCLTGRMKGGAILKARKSLILKRNLCPRSFGTAELYINQRLRPCLALSKTKIVGTAKPYIESITYDPYVKGGPSLEEYFQLRWPK